MFRSWKLGTLGGVAICVHSTCLFLVALQLLQPLVAGGWPLAMYRLTLYLAVLGCIVLHELGHARMARHYGIATHDITLYPIGGVASLERMSEKPSEEFWIALAGPAVSVVIAAILRLLTVILPDWCPVQTAAGFQPGYFVCHLALINVGLVIFNLLPAFPMDGGRMLRALLSGPLGRLRATRIAAGVGSVLALVLGIGEVMSGQILLVLVAAFVYFVGNRELANVQRGESIEQIPAVKTRMLQPDTEIPEGVPIDHSQDRHADLGGGSQCLGVLGRWPPRSQISDPRIGCEVNHHCLKTRSLKHSGCAVNCSPSFIPDWLHNLPC